MQRGWRDKGVRIGDVMAMEKGKRKWEEKLELVIICVPLLHSNQFALVQRRRSAPKMQDGAYSESASTGLK